MIEDDTWHLAPGTWHLAPGTWHLAPGTWHLAPGTWQAFDTLDQQALIEETINLLKETGACHMTSTFDGD